MNDYEYCVQKTKRNFELFIHDFGSKRKIFISSKIWDTGLDIGVIISCVTSELKKYH